MTKVDNKKQSVMLGKVKELASYITNEKKRQKNGLKISNTNS